MMTVQHSFAAVLPKRVVTFIKSARNICSSDCAQRPYVDHDGSKHCMLDAAALGSSSDGHQEVFQARELKNEYFNDAQSHRGRLLDA